MNSKRLLFIGIGAGLIVGLFAILGIRGSREQGATRRDGGRISPIVATTGTSTQAAAPDVVVNSRGGVVTNAFTSAEHWSVPSGARVLLVPHHLVAAKQIASLFASVPKPSRVILLTPDHLGVGKGIVTIGDAPISVDGGFANSDSELAKRISSAVHASAVDTSSVSNELAVQALLPMVVHAWPDASVVPVIVRASASSTSPGSVHLRAALADAIQNALADDPNALLVASVDFSHYLPAEVADFHDVLAEDVISSLADQETDRVELDNPDVLAVALKAARELGLGNVTIHAHTNSLRILQSEFSSESTSYIVASFAPGTIRKQEATSLLFLGDVMLDRTVRARMSLAISTDMPFDHIEGEEGRFFNGQDLVVANLEGPVTAVRRPPEKLIDFAFDPSVVKLLKRVGIDAVSQANNHDYDQGRAGADESRSLLESGGLAVFGDEVNDSAARALTILERRGVKIALLGFNDSDRPVDREVAAQTFAKAKAEADRVIVFVHWGEEYHDKPNARQEDLARWFIDEGADAVIGGHPHWMESVAVYKNRLIAYSLGNFVFDQDWSEETKYGLAIGLVLNEGGSELRLFPIRINASRPELLTGAARNARLDRLASVSDPSLADGIRAGIIRVSR